MLEWIFREDPENSSVDYVPWEGPKKNTHKKRDLNTD